MIGRPYALMLVWIVLIQAAGCDQATDDPTKAAGIVVRGAGATFPAPLYEKWIHEYGFKDPDVTIEYAVVGSGTGTELFLDEMIDFGASDAALTDDQMAQMDRGALLVPMTAGCISVVYNLEGISEQIRLPRDVYSSIFMGEIDKWNDPRIQEANPGIDLPALAIAVVARQDGSGTTYAFTNHLSNISDSWAEGPGTGKAIDWPGGAMLANGNEGVATMVLRVPGAIAYVESGLADRLGLQTASIENKAGNFVKPSRMSGTETLRNTPLPANLRAFFPDPAGERSYPVVTYSWLLLYKRYPDSPKVSAKLKDFVKWCLVEGQHYSEDLGYVPLSPDVVNQGVESVDTIQ